MIILLQFENILIKKRETALKKFKELYKLIKLEYFK